MLDAMVNTLNLSRYLANQVMHYRSRSLDNVSIKIAHFPVSSDLKPSEEAPIMDMLIIILRRRIMVILMENMKKNLRISFPISNQ